MTDITNQDAAFRFAKTVTRPVRGVPKTEDMLAAARYILATMEAPAPTLTERLREQFHYPEQNDEQHGIIIDAEQMEHDLAEARAEVERLTAEQEVLNTINDHYDRYAVQERAESNAETTDPAGVKPGEAWIVECRGERRTAVKDRDDDEPWNTVASDGLFFSEENENVTLLHRLVPAPRVITNTDELEALPHRTVIRDSAGVMFQRIVHGWYQAGDMSVHRSDDNFVCLPVTVLWEPEA